MNRPVLSPFFWRSAVTVAPVTGSPPSSRTRPVITPAVARAIVRFSTFWPSARIERPARRARPPRAQRGVHIASLRGAQAVTAFGHRLEHERPGGVGRHQSALRLMAVAEGHLRPPQREAGVGGHDTPADHAGPDGRGCRPGRRIPWRCCRVRPGRRLRRKRHRPQGRAGHRQQRGRDGPAGEEGHGRLGSDNAATRQGEQHVPYPEYLVAPMREELTSLGVKELRTSEAVDQAVQSTPGTLMIVVNSVCGCAAGKARPGIALALNHSVTPDVSATVFAGADTAATDRARRVLRRLSAVVPVGRHPQGRQARLHDGAPPNREPFGRSDRQRPRRRLRQALRRNAGRRLAVRRYVAAAGLTGGGSSRFAGASAGTIDSGRPRW